MKRIKIKGTGNYLPQRLVTSAAMDAKMGYPIGFTEKISGVSERYYAESETASEMACHAIQEALAAASMNIEAIDCIIASSGTMEQALPCNAVKISQLLKSTKPIPAFDINMTCLGTLMALDVAADLIKAGSYKTILIVASEVASVGLDWKNVKTAGNFGDGAAAIILQQDEFESQTILGSKFETYPEGGDYCQIKGGGTRLHPIKIKDDYMQLCMFEMHGKKLYKLAADILPGFAARLLEKVNLTVEQIDWFVPHQASEMGLLHMQKKLGIASEKMINIIKNHGNQISASIPTALQALIKSKQIKKGHKILLLGTGAGLSLGGLILEW